MKKNVYLVALFAMTLSFACSTKIETEDLKVKEVLLKNEKVTVERLFGQSGELAFIQEKYLKPDLKSTENIQINFNEVLKYKFENSDLEFFFFEVVNNSTQSLVVLKRDNEVLFVLSKYSVYDGIISFSLGTISNQSYFDINLNDENEVIDFTDYSLISLKDEIYNIFGENASLKSAQRATCDDVTSDYFECYKCAIRELTDDLVDTVACSIFVSSCLTAVAIHCL